MPHLEPGCEPHPSIVSTMGHLAVSNVIEFVPVIKVTLGIMVPMMTPARGELIRIAFAIGTFIFWSHLFIYLFFIALSLIIDKIGILVLMTLF